MKILHPNGVSAHEAELGMTTYLYVALAMNALIAVATEMHIRWLIYLH